MLWIEAWEAEQTDTNCDCIVVVLLLIVVLMYATCKDYISNLPLFFNKLLEYLVENQKSGC